MQGAPPRTSRSASIPAERLGAARPTRLTRGVRTVAATHGRRQVVRDPEHERALARHLGADYPRDAIAALYDLHRHGENRFSSMMRRVTLRALCRRFGDGVTVEPGVRIRHPETFDIGDGVYIGADVNLQGRHDGSCQIGARSWIGPGAFLDARALILEDYVGWGPGARVLGSEHSGKPANVPIITTDLRVKPVLVRYGADIGIGSVVLPGVTIGKGAIVGAGAVVVEDVPDDAVVAGVPARLLRHRSESKRNRKRRDTKEKQ